MYTDWLVDWAWAGRLRSWPGINMIDQERLKKLFDVEENKAMVKSSKLKKKQVIKVFSVLDEFGEPILGVTRLAKAIGIVPQAVSRWPDVLNQYMIDAVISAAWRERHEGYPQKLAAIGVKVERRGE
jgi:hypothetical protein